MDARIMAYINELKHQRDLLADILNKVGVEASKDEKFNTLIPKVLSIYGITFFINVSDSFGVIPVETADIQMMPISENINASADETTQQGITESFAPIQISSTEITFGTIGETVSSEII